MTTSSDGSANQNRFITVAALVGLVAVQTLVAIIYKLAQKNGKYTFSTASALTMAEFIKIWLSFGLHSRATGWENALPELKVHIKKAPYVQIVGLAFSYFINNHLNFYLFLWADPVSITVMKSGASFITAILSWIVLARFISHIQWSAILLQVAGLCLLQYDPCRNSTTLEWNGYFIMFISVSIASANGIWNERLLKSYDCSLNVQNMILYTSGTVFNFILFLIHSDEIGFFEGYNVPAVIVVFLNAVIGLTITVIYKYTNAIAKTFCSAVATVVLFIVNATLFNTPASLNSVLSCIVVFVATYLYTQGADNSKAKDYSKLPTSQLDVEEPAPRTSVFGFLSARRIGAVMFGALIVTSVVIAIQTANGSTSAAPNSTIITPTSENVGTPTTSASSMVKDSGIVSPPSKEFFDDILVIIHFHSPHFRHLPVILSEYGRVFKNIVICAQKKDNLVDYVCTKGQVEGGGHFMYTCVADIMEAYPNFKGYLAFHFDVIINYWNFPSFDKTKPWITLTPDNTGPYPINEYRQDNIPPDGWGWWGSEYGVIACIEAVKSYTAEEKDKMGKAWGFQDGVYRGMGDLYYIPQTKSEEYIRLARMFQRNNVFLEIAVPTIANLIEFPAYPVNITGVFDWSYLHGWEKAKSWGSIYGTKLNFAHPYPWFRETAYDEFKKMMQFGYTAN